MSDPTASANEEGRPVENEAAFSTRSDHDTEARIADGDATDARHAAVLSIPELDADVDNLTAALAYADAGIYILPVKRGTKNPGSIVGRVWQDKSSRDIEVITAWFAGTDHGIAIDLGRSGLVVIDVDRPEMQPEWLQNVLSASGAPYPGHPAGFARQRASHLPPAVGPPNRLRQGPTHRHGAGHQGRRRRDHRAADAASRGRRVPMGHHGRDPRAAAAAARDAR